MRVNRYCLGCFRLIHYEIECDCIGNRDIHLVSKCCAHLEHIMDYVYYINDPTSDTH